MKPESQSWSCLGVIGPVLAEPVGVAVEVPVELGLESPKTFRRRKSVAGAVLRVEQHIVLEPADEYGILVGLKEQPLGTIQQMTKTLGVGNAAAIGRNRRAHILAAGQIIAGCATSEPTGNTVDRNCGQADAEY